MGALSGFSVIALATNIPGPVAAARLATMGATVVKVEPLAGDPLQSTSEQWYDDLTSAMRVERRDLRDPAQREWLRSQLDASQLLLTTMRAGAIERLGLSWHELHRAHPSLSHVAVFGEAPPNDGRAGHDLTYQARAGFVAPPAMPATLLGDMAAAERVVSASLEALLQWARSGEPARHTVAIVDAAMDFAAPRRYGLTSPGGSLGGGLDTYRLYRAADGWLAVALLEPHFAEAFASLVGAGRLDERTIERAVSARTLAEWEVLAEAHDLPLAAVR